MLKQTYTAMANSKNINKAIEAFQQHYNQRLGNTRIEVEPFSSNKQCCFIHSGKLKKGNGPRILHHGKMTKDVIILTHGLSDSPFYMEAVGKRFFAAGLNVMLPLLPAHGLKKADKALEDLQLDRKWRDEIDAAVQIAGQLGKRISIGGFSTGGTLSYNKILRDPAMIKGGLFLFSAAIDIGLIREASRFSFVQSITRMTDGEIKGIGRNPYKYPKFPSFGAYELSQVIRENRKLSKNNKISHPVFAAHSVHDTSAKLQGIISLLEYSVTKGLAFIIAENVKHSELPLEADIPLNTRQSEGPKTAPRANPRFEDMMQSCLGFFKKEVSRKM